jgi:glycosyltransferase involved in cell wall biosynthesis
MRDFRLPGHPPNGSVPRMSSVGSLPVLKVALLTTDNRWLINDYNNPTPHFGTAPQALLDGFAGMPGVDIHIVSSSRKPVNAPPKLAENIWFHSQHVPKFGWMRTAYQGCIRATRRTLREIRPDIVHGQGTELDCSISAVLSGFPSVLTIHGNMRMIARLEGHKFPSFMWFAARLETFTLPRSDGVVCITRYTEGEVAGLARRTWIVPNGVDPSFFEIDAQPPWDAPPRVLCVGRVCLRKNQNALIRALDTVSRTRKFELIFLGVISGDDPYCVEFQRLVQERPWCSIAGFADRKTLRTFFREAALLVLPSLEDNCPMVVLEAMAAGVPVIAARVGGVPDLIEDGGTGWFCDPHDAASMSSQVEKVLADPDAAARMARQAKTRSRERFHPQVIARRHIEIYREVLGG